MTLIALALAFAMTAPGLAPAGAAVARNAGRTEMQAGRPAAQSRLAARHRQKKKHHKKLTPAQKKALLLRYIKTHPGVVAAHKSGGLTLAQKMRANHGAKAHTKGKRSGTHKKGKKSKGNKSKKHKKSKKKTSSSGLRHYAILFGGAVLGGLALFLIYSSVRNRPRARAMARAKQRPSPLTVK